MPRNPEAFWREAAASLPPEVRARYAPYFEHAKRLELALDDVVELVSRAKSWLARSLHVPGTAAGGKAGS